MPGIENQPGFQGSETSRAEVIVYQHATDPVVLVPEGRGSFPFSGKKRGDPNPSLLAVTTNKSLGAASGAFAIQVKPSRSGWSESLFQELVDDDWVDIVFYRHNQPWHVMRGLIDEVRRSKTVGGTGAATEVWTITGRDFAKIWEITPVWFSPYANNDIVTDAVAFQTFDAMPAILGAPPDAVQGYLRGFLENISARSGPDWRLPTGMPAVSPEGALLENVGFTTKYYQNVPARRAFNPNYMTPQGTLWSLAQQHSDPLFTELYADLLPNVDPFSPKLAAGEPLTPDDTYMTVVIRDKPFPTTARVEDFVPWWDQVPVFTVPRQQIVSSDLGRSGFERFNAYFLASLLHQETGQYALDQLAPLLNLEEIKRHGMRRMDVQSQMSPDPYPKNFMGPRGEGILDFGALSDTQRKIVRDWYALNPYYISGTINLGIGRPDIKIGCRVRVPGAASEDEDESYYIENVSHSWQFGTSIKTGLGVTRGWIGTDASHLDKLTKVVAKYTIPTAIRDSQ